MTALAPPPWASASRTRWALAALVACLVALTLADAWLEQHTGLPVGLPMSSDATKPDLLFGYTHADVVALFASYGQAGRRAYAVGLVIDTIYPIVLAVAAVLASARAFGRRAQWLWVFPATFAVLDVLENVGLAVALASYPGVSPTLIAVLSPVTQVKLLSFPPTAALVGAAATVLMFRALQRRRQRAAAGGGHS